jgi:hypothetical protein
LCVFRNEVFVLQIAMLRPKNFVMQSDGFRPGA